VDDGDDDARDDVVGVDVGVGVGARERERRASTRIRRRDVARKRETRPSSVDGRGTRRRVGVGGDARDSRSGGNGGARGGDARPRW